MSKKTTGPAITVTNSDGLIAMARDSERNNRNRQVDTGLLERDLEPGGVHVLLLRMPHAHIAGKPSDIHWRTLWLVKTKFADEPMHLFIDVSPDVFDESTLESGLV